MTIPILLPVGARVKLIRLGIPAGFYDEGPSNPLWGGTQGRIMGTITDNEHQEFPHGMNYQVDWDNGEHNTYRDGDLVLFTSTILSSAERTVDPSREFQIGEAVMLIGDFNRHPDWARHVGEVARITEYVRDSAIMREGYNWKMKWPNGDYSSAPADNIRSLEAHHNFDIPITLVAPKNFEWFVKDKLK